MSEEPAPRPGDSGGVHPAPLTPGSIPGGVASTSRRIPKQLAAALAQTLADALDAAGAAAIRQALSIPANPGLSDRQIIDLLWTIKDPTKRARCARLVDIGQKRVLAQLGLISERFSAYAVFGLEALNTGGAEGFGKPTPHSKRPRKAAHRDDQIALYVASAVAYLRARHRTSISKAIGWLRAGCAKTWAQGMEGALRMAVTFS